MQTHCRELGPGGDACVWHSAGAHWCLPLVRAAESLVQAEAPRQPLLSESRETTVTKTSIGGDVCISIIKAHL